MCTDYSEEGITAMTMRKSFKVTDRVPPEIQPYVKAMMGASGLNEPVTLWIIDQRPYNPPQGGVWYYIDSLSWLSPIPVAPVSGSLVDYDPVSGRASQIYIS